MRHQKTIGPAGQSGVVLVISLLLLVVITLLALSMFRSVGMQEMIAGSLREKDRALQSAMSAEQYGEWWLMSGNNINNIITCAAPTLNANIGQGHVCTNSLTAIAGITNVTTVPWNAASGAEVGTYYTPPNMSATGSTAGAGFNNFWLPPRYYIALLGAAPSGEQGNIYQIDAWGYGGDPNTVAVVESTYLVTTGITDLGGG
jgi:type IV pilus assembly protein PilX